MPQENCGNSRLRMAVRLALTGGTLAASYGVANAQTAPPPQAAATPSAPEEVVVTGSRIAVPNQTSISPVTVSYTHLDVYKRQSCIGAQSIPIL